MSSPSFLEKRVSSIGRQFGAGVALLIAVSGCSHGSANVAAAPSSADAFSPGLMRSRLFSYADDSMLGRETGHPGNVKATTFIAGQVQALGLEAGGDNGTYFQTLPLVGRALDSTTNVTVDGAPLELWKDYAPLPPIEGIPVAESGALNQVPVVYGGRMGDSVAVLSADDAKGKIVVLGPAMDPTGKEVFNLSMGSIIRYQGATAIAMANWDMAPPGVTDFLRQSGSEMKEGADDPAAARPLAIFVTRAAAEKMLGGSFSSLQPGATGKSINGKIAFTETQPEAPARNVIAILRGSDPALAGEFVAIGAHNDHIGTTDEPVDADSIWAFNKVMRPMGAENEPGIPSAEQAARIKTLIDSVRKTHPAGRVDSVYNGADDDGSGSMTVLSIAQAFAQNKIKPKRSIIFVWHTGEEEGLWGSDWFTRHSTIPRDSIVAQLNIDMVGRGGANDLKGGGPGYLQLIGSRRLSTELGDLVESVNKSDKHGFTFDYSYDANGHPDNIYCRSDHAMYARFGIPIVFFTTGGHSDYHMLSDEPQRIDYTKMSHVGSLVYDIALHVADLDHRVVVDKPKPDPEAPCKQ